MVARTLITTADERTWPENKTQPVLFLGEWCRRYSRKELWKQLDAEVAPYHWDDREKLFQDYQYIQGVYEKLLAELSSKLNQIHSVDHSLRYWSILIGPWLGYFIQMLYDRWFMLKSVIEQSDITNCIVLDRDDLMVVPNDMAHFIKLFVEDDWNEAIYHQLLTLCCGSVISLSRSQAETCSSSRKIVAGKGRRPVKRRVLEKMILFFNRLFPKNDGYFFISSYLPLKADLKLQIKLGQFPKLWHTQPTPITQPELQQRQWWLGDGESIPDSFEAILHQLIPLHIPTAYLEGYEKLANTAEQLPWPNKPKSIFTSNAYSGDDLFKFWAAEKIELGTHLVIGQHGGHFGMAPFSFHEEHQIKIADKWISWGWTDRTRPQISAVGNFKEIDRKVKYDPQGGALMVDMTVPRYSYHLYAAPVSKQWLDYFEDQKRFLKAMPDDLRKQILLRLCHHDYGWDQEARWNNEMPNVKLDSGRQNIRKLINKSRLYIATYNATTYLESLTWNVPTIIFWNPDHWELNADAKSYIDLLKSVGIFHETPESAVQQMMKVWDDVAVWWLSEAVQSARRSFCYQFARSSDDTLNILTDLFKEICAERNVSALKSDR